MALLKIGSAAGEAVDAPGRRDTVVPQRNDTPDHLLEAVRRGLTADDPVARLLAEWPHTPAAPAVEIPRTRSATAPSAPPGAAP